MSADQPRKHTASAYKAAQIAPTDAFHPYTAAQMTTTVGGNPNPPAQHSASVPDGAFAPGADPYGAIPLGSDAWEA